MRFARFRRISETELTELRRRINATKWPERETVTDATQGVQLATIQALARYWGTEYDWRKCEAKLNALPQFITEIDGLDIHSFTFVRNMKMRCRSSSRTDGPVGCRAVEDLSIRSPIPRRMVRAHRRFRLVIPSIPRLRVFRQADHHRLGPGPHCACLGRADEAPWIHEFVAQGGDWGAVITEQMGVKAAPELLGHSHQYAWRGSADMTGRHSPVRQCPTVSHRRETRVRTADIRLQQRHRLRLPDGLRPQTLYGIADSPVGLAAYFLDHDAWSYALISRVFSGEAAGLTRDDVLDNITITWLTNTAISGARLYWESKLPYFSVKGVSIPVAVSGLSGRESICARAVGRSGRIPN